MMNGIETQDESSSAWLNNIVYRDVRHTDAGSEEGTGGLDSDITSQRFYQVQEGDNPYWETILPQSLFI